MEGNRNVKKKKGGALAFLISALFLLFIVIIAASCGGDKKEDYTPPVSLEPTHVDSNQTKPEANAPAADEEVLLIVLETMKTNFEGIAEITINEDERAIYLMPTDPDFIMGLWLTAEGNPDLLASWNQLVEQQRDLSLHVDKLLPGYSICLLNPENTELSLLVTAEGCVVYNFVTQ